MQGTSLACHAKTHPARLLPQKLRRELTRHCKTEAQAPQPRPNLKLPPFATLDTMQEKGGCSNPCKQGAPLAGSQWKTQACHMHNTHSAKDISNPVFQELQSRLKSPKHTGNNTPSIGFDCGSGTRIQNRNNLSPGRVSNPCNARHHAEGSPLQCSTPCRGAFAAAQGTMLLEQQRAQAGCRCDSTQQM
jgi:hypothetical protein